MGLKKLKKKAKKATKTVKKTAEKTVDKTVDVAKSAFKSFKKFNVSKEVNQLANDAGNKMKDFGNDVKKAMEDVAMKKILKELAEQVVKDNKKLIETMTEAGKKLQKQSNIKNEIKGMAQDKKKGRLDSKKVDDLKKKAGLEDYF